MWKVTYVARNGGLCTVKGIDKNDLLMKAYDVGGLVLTVGLVSDEEAEE